MSVTMPGLIFGFVEVKRHHLLFRIRFLELEKVLSL